MKNFSKSSLSDHHSDRKRNLEGDLEANDLEENDLEANDNEFKGVCYTGISLIAFVIVVITSIGLLVL